MVVPLIAAGAAVIGAGLSAYGAFSSASAASDQAAASREAAEASRQIAAFEKQIEAQKFKAMEIESRRKSLEAIRGAQRARAMALTAATAQGAGAGSGLQGGYGGISGQQGTNLVGINQALEIGRTIFGFQGNISDQKMLIADAQGRSATAGAELARGQAFSQIGGQLLSSAGTIGNIGGNLFGSGTTPSPTPAATGSIPPSYLNPNMAYGIYR